ncbi:unnamed protein product [Durusdinium trenchii]|uniref:Uncharacterized protein n=1 Tax=Durusdinium trenchii TaxID=1381693 RepID=A0ABP0NG19_9DINO
MVRMVVFLRLLPVAVVALYNTAFVGTEKQRRTVRRAEGTHVDLDEVDIRALQELLPLREARTEARCVVIGEAAPRGEEEKAALVKRLLAAKRFSGKTFDEIAKELGYTNAYTANLFFNQAQLKERSAEKLKEWEGLAMLNRRDIEMMKQPPTRSFDPAILQVAHDDDDDEKMPRPKVFGAPLEGLVSVSIRFDSVLFRFIGCEP